MPPQLIAAIAGRDMVLFRLDCEQRRLIPLPGRGLLVDEPALML